MRENDALTWLLTDQQGSTVATANESGALLSEMRYSAFGETRTTSGTTPTDYLYTGQRDEAEVGLYYYVARFYDPALGRFIQADTLIPEPGSPQSWDRYAYANNNPVKFTDPSGNKACSEVDKNGKCITDGNTFIKGYTLQELVNSHQYQGSTPYCGPYSVAMVSNLLTGSEISGDEVNDFLVAQHLKFRNYGITRNSLANGSQLLLPDNKVTSQKNGTIEQLKKNVNNGKFAVVGVSWQTSSEILDLVLFKNSANDRFNGVIVGHWMVVAGYNDYSHTIILLDPGNKSSFTTYYYSDFEQIWKNQSNLFIGSGDIITIK